jgi:hypothetical protein
MVDYKVDNNDEWQIFRYDIKNPGMYSFIWIYTKYVEAGGANGTDTLSAEIEVNISFVNLI